MKKTPYLLTAAATLVGLWLRLNGLTRLGLGTDEGHSAWVSMQPLAKLPAILWRDSAPPLYYVMLHFWQAIFPSDTGIRLLSVLLGTASVPLAFFVGRKLIGPWCGAAAAFFMAAAAYHGQFSQIAKNDALLVLLSQLALLALLRACEDPSRRLAWTGYALATAALLYTHAVAPFVIAALGAVFVIQCWGRLKPALKPWVLAHVAAAALFLPWAGVAMHQVKEVSGAFWAKTPSLAAPAKTFARFLIVAPPPPLSESSWLEPGRGGVPPRNSPLVRAAGLVPVRAWFLPAVVALAAGLPLLIWAGRIRESLVLAALYVVPVGTVWLVSRLVASIYLDRVLLPAMIPLTILPAVPIAMLAGEGKALPGRPPRGLLRLGAALSAVSLCMMAFSCYYLGARRLGQQWREAAAYLAASASPGDAVVYVAHFGQILFDRYLGETSSHLDAYGLPSGWYADGTPTVGRWVRSEGDLGPLKEAAARHRTIWLVRAHTQVHDPHGLALAWCETHLKETQQRRFLGIWVTRFESAEAASAEGGGGGKGGT